MDPICPYSKDSQCQIVEELCDGKNYEDCELWKERQPVSKDYEEKKKELINEYGYADFQEFEQLALEEGKRLGREEAIKEIEKIKEMDLCDGDMLTGGCKGDEKKYKNCFECYMKELIRKLRGIK